MELRTARGAAIGVALRALAARAVPSAIARVAVVVMAMVVATVSGLAFATPAWAHSQLLATYPTSGAALTAPITEVDLTYNERVQGTFTTVVVNGPGGVSYSDGHAQVIDDVVHQKVYPLRSGAYSVAWRAISADGHPVEGQFRFTMTLPPGEEPAAGPSAPHAATPGGGGHPGAWIGGGIGVLVVVGLIVALAIRPRRSAGAGTGSESNEDKVNA